MSALLTTESLPEPHTIPSRGRARALDRLALVVTVMCTVAVCAPFFRYVQWFGDEGIVLNAADKILRGERLYGDFFELLPPASFLIGTAWMKLIGSSLASIDSGSFFRYVMPAFPAFCVLAASLLLLVPTLGGRLASQVRARRPSRRGPIAIVAAGVAAFALAGVVTLSATQLRGDIHVLKVDESQPLIPVVDDLAPEISADGRRITLRWSPTAGTSARWSPSGK